MLPLEYRRVTGIYRIKLKMISGTTEIMLMITVGLTTTLWESTTHCMNDHLREVWALEFPPDSLIGVGSLIRTVMTAIALARGLTLHIYLVAYVLLVFPVLFEKGTMLLLLWMLICAVRSVVVNLVAFMTGCFLCSTYSELKQPCFEFVAAKAIEMSCSVFMWLSISDFNIYLRNKQRRHFLATRMSTKTTQISDSDLSAESSDMSAASFQDFDEEASSEESVMVKAAVDWLMRMAFGIKYESRRMDMDSTKAQKFLNMSPDELKALQNRIKEKLFDNNNQTNLTQSSPKDAGGQSGIKNDGTANVQPEKAPSVTSTGSQTKDPSKKLKVRLDAAGSGSETTKAAKPGTSKKPSPSNEKQFVSTSRTEYKGKFDKVLPSDSNPEVDNNPVVLLSRQLSRAPSDIGNQYKRNSYLRAIASSHVGPTMSYDEYPTRNIKHKRPKLTQESTDRKGGSKETRREKIVTDSWSEPSEFFQ